MMAGGVPAYDYIVVGAGSAGAVVAARLTEDPKTSVLLIEAGPGDAGFFSHVPLWFAKISRTRATCGCTKQRLSRS